MDEERKYYIDFIKIISTFLVIFNHTGNTGFLAFQGQDNIILKVIEILCSSFCLVAVPLFFMCSGVLLLSKAESISGLYKKRVVKYLTVILVFTLGYYVSLSLYGHAQMSLWWILNTLCSTTTFSFSGSYWFLYSYVAFLIMLPIFRIIAKHITREIMIYICTLYFVFGGMLPLLEYTFGFGNIALAIPFVTNPAFFYPLVGFYIEENDISYFRNKKIMFAAMIMTAISFVSSTVISLLSLRQDQFINEYLTIFEGFIVIFVFILGRDAFKKVKLTSKIKKVIQQISSCTFGIYLIHGFVFTFMIRTDTIYTGIGYVDSWLMVFFVFLIGLLVTYILRKIPIIRCLF